MFDHVKITLNVNGCIKALHIPQIPILARLAGMMQYMEK